MRKIIMLTSRYPFGIKETFITPELKYSYNKFQIDIIPTISGISKMNVRTVPQHVSIVPLLDKKFTFREKVYCIVLALCRKSTWKELFFIINEKKSLAKKINNLIRFVARGERIVKVLEKQYYSEFRTQAQGIIIYSYWMLDTAYAAARLSKKYGCKAITRAHGVDLYQNRNILNYIPMRYYLLENLNKVFSVSLDGLNYMQKEYGCFDNIQVSYLGTEDYGVHNLTLLEEDFVIVSCARMIPLKRIDILANALAEISNRRIRWIHFGDGPEMCRIEEIVNQYSDNVDVCLMGDVSHKSVLSYYKENDVHLFINTSITEGVPVSIMEAISFGIPVIATDVGGTKEVVRNNYNGLCVNPTISSKEIANHIEKFLYMDKDEYLGYRKNSRELWEKKFSAECNYKSFYRSLY